MRLPTKNDIDRVLASLNNLEAKINDLSDKIDEIKTGGRVTSKKSAS
jgi:hypothetical protein